MEEATHKFSVLLRSNGENDAHLEKLQKLAIMGQMEKNSGNGITDVDLNQTKKVKVPVKKYFKIIVAFKIIFLEKNRYFGSTNL